MRPENDDRLSPAECRQGASLVKARNLAAKHGRAFNRAVVMRDRKKAAKRGYTKHRRAYAT